MKKYTVLFMLIVALSAQINLAEADWLAEWEQLGFNEMEARSWLNAGVRRPQDAVELKQAGFSQEDTNNLGDVGVDFKELKGELVEWGKTGFGLQDSVELKRAGFSTQAAVEWKRAGFDVDEAIKWKAIVSGSEEAKSWLKAGVTYPELAEELSVKFGGFSKARKWLKKECPKIVSDEELDNLMANPFPAKGECGILWNEQWAYGHKYLSGAGMIQLLGKSKGLYSMGRKIFFLDFGKNAATKVFSGIFKIKGIYQYTTVAGAKAVIPYLFVEFNLKKPIGEVDE